MPIPTIIPARNEIHHIKTTLDALSRQSYEVEPIVVANGSTDRTADVAKEAGATVLESPEGKMPAIQSGLRHLGRRALEPVLILDADSRPLTKNWSSLMSQEVQKLASQKPAIIWGPYLYSGEINPILGAFFTATTMRISWADRNNDKPRTIRGGNTGLFMRQNELLEKILALENYWPREDVAIFDTMKSCDSDHKVIFRPDAWVLTSGYRITETLKKIVRERRHPSLVMDGSYASEAPKDSKPYFSSTTDTAVHDKP